MKVVIVGQSPSWIDKIKKQLDSISDEAPGIKVSSTHPSYIDSVISDDLKLIILTTNQMNGMMFSFVDKIRDLGFAGSVVMVGHLPSQCDLSDVAKRENLFFVKRPYGMGQLKGLVINALQADNVKQCRDQRFDVRELATLEAYSNDFKTQTVINNISRSGVRITGNLSGLATGDLLRLDFNFEQIQKRRQMSARVVWVKKDGDNAEQAGLEFVSQRLVYQYLLDHAVA